MVLHPSQWRCSNTFSQALKSCKKKKGKGKRKGVQKSLYGERDIASKKPLLSPIPELPEVSETPLVGSLVQRMCPGNVFFVVTVSLLPLCCHLPPVFPPFLFFPSCSHKNVKKQWASSLTVQWLRLQASNAGAMSLIPGRGTKIPHATRCGQKSVFLLLVFCLFVFLKQ